MEKIHKVDSVKEKQKELITEIIQADEKDGLYDMGRYICNACEVEKQKSSFHNCKNCKDGIVKICKTCKLQGRHSLKVKEQIHPFNEEFRQTEKKHYSLNGCGKNEYQHMYMLMEKMGFDVNKDIHQQFLDRHNQKLHEPLNYKLRNYNMKNCYLPDGSVNPLGQKKTPTKK